MNALPNRHLHAITGFKFACLALLVALSLTGCDRDTIIDKMNRIGIGKKEKPMLSDSTQLEQQPIDKLATDEAPTAFEHIRLDN